MNYDMEFNVTGNAFIFQSIPKLQEKQKNIYVVHCILSRLMNEFIFEYMEHYIG